MKIVSRGRVLNTSAFYEKKKHRRKLLLVLSLLGFLAVLFLIVYTARQERFLIDDVAVEGENINEREEVAKAVEQMLDGYYLWLMPRRNFLLYPREGMTKSLLKNFPHLKSVALKLVESRDLVVAVEGRVPTALYCQSVLSDLQISDCFFLDEDGFIFAPAPSFSGIVYFVYTKENPLAPAIGQNVLPAEEFQRLSKFLEVFKGLKIYSTSLQIGTKELNLSMSNGGTLLWRRNADLAIIRADLEAFLGSETVKNEAGFLDRVSRLDLRTDHKVFFKMKDQL